MSGPSQANVQENVHQGIAGPAITSQQNVSQEAGPEAHAETNIEQLPTTEETAHVEPAPAIEVDVDVASDSGYGGSDG